jgi:molybdopterin-guanine dinucleotide biosynthesis protein A
LYPDITGIILSGGKSSRMGVNKSLLKINDKTIIGYVVELMQNIFSKVILITNNPDDYGFLGLETFEDIYEGYGPLAGIHSGLLNSSTKRNFVISCDVPLMTEQMIKYLVDYPTDKLITIAKADGFIQQLVGIYNRDIIVAVKEILGKEKSIDERNSDQQKRGCRVLSLVNQIGAEIINTDSLSFYIPDTYFNMNSINDFNLVKEKLKTILANRKQCS